MIKAKGPEFTHVYEENRRHIVDVLGAVAETSREYWWQDTEGEATPWMVGFCPTTLVKLTGDGDDSTYPFSLPIHPPTLTQDQGLTMVNRLIDEALVARGYASGAFKFEYRGDPVDKVTLVRNRLAP